MVECNSIEISNTYPNLNDQQQFRFNKIDEIKVYSVAVVRARGLMSQRLSRFIAFVHYFDKSFTTVIGVPVGIASAKHNRIVMLA